MDPVDGRARNLGAEGSQLRRLGLERAPRLRLRDDGKLEPMTEEDGQLYEQLMEQVRQGRVNMSARVPIHIVDEKGRLYRDGDGSQMKLAVNDGRVERVFDRD